MRGNTRDACGGVRNGKGEKMKILFIDDEYYRYPEGINAVEDYMAYLNNSNSFFIKMVRFETDNCRFPYLIEEETRDVYLNISKMGVIYEAEATILTCEEYEERLKKVVAEKCIYCQNYTDGLKGDNLSGHRGNITLDGDCFLFSKIDEKEQECME